mmetsp:Transcript_55432/g.124607  ORF Transcript_55432/g.124607 Transcript_55432/m.124607 type:complete len:431 (-) Transcript_55432:18-1310(-)
MWPYAGPPPGPPPPCAGAQQPHGGLSSTAAPLAPAGTPQEASTSVNIAVLDAKDFPAEIAPTNDLYTEFVLADGSVLFKCPHLVKASGIDLMNCPLNLVLKLLVKMKTTPTMALWHVVLPLPTISKSLTIPPFEWETWIGLFPNTQNLEQHPADTMFAQAVHLISRPDFPKLRLRFSYHNPQLQEQLVSQQRQKEEQSRRRVEETQKFGKAEFEELMGLAMQNPAPQASPGPVSRPIEVPRPSPVARDGAAAAPVAGKPAGYAPDYPQQVSVPVAQSSGDPVRDAMVSSLRFMDAVRIWLESQQVRPPRALEPSEVLSSPHPAALVDNQSQHLQQCLQAVPAGGAFRGSSSGDPEVESMLVEALQMAMMGMLDHRDEGKLPKTMTNLSNSTTDQLAAVRRRYPRLWETLAEVSTLATERASLIERQRQMR